MPCGGARVEHSKGDFCGNGLVVTAQAIKRLGLDPKHSWLPSFLPCYVPTTHKHLKHFYVQPVGSPGEKGSIRVGLTMKDAIFSKAVSFPLQEDLLLLTGVGKHTLSSL